MDHVIEFSVISLSLSFSYGSDTSDLVMNRSQTDHLSVSPIPHTPHSITEVDAINNNNNTNNNNSRTAEANALRKTGLLSMCPNQCKSDGHPKISPTRRQNQQQQHHQTFRDQANTSTIDTRLADWLTASNIDPISKNLILAEQFTYDDFIYGMEKTDLYRIGLK